MRYKPERALTLSTAFSFTDKLPWVEMRYKPERALTHGKRILSCPLLIPCRNEV